MVNSDKFVTITCKFKTTITVTTALITKQYSLDVKGLGHSHFVRKVSTTKKKTDGACLSNVFVVKRFG